VCRGERGQQHQRAEFYFRIPRAATGWNAAGDLHDLGFRVMTISGEFFGWGTGLLSQLHDEALNTTLTRSPEDRDNRSTHLLVESEAAACDLMVWDSGDAEYMVFGDRGIVPTHFDIERDVTARELYEKFVDDASEVVGRRLVK
jgi:hypothetical protein